MVLIAGWSSPVARQAHNLKAAGSNPAPATKSLHQYINGLAVRVKFRCLTPTLQNTSPLSPIITTTYIPRTFLRATYMRHRNIE